VDRYYGTASTAPASVFGNLLRTAQSHLGKLRRSDADRGFGVNRQKELGEIMSKLDDFPNTLSAQQQALFGLGYYQQRQARFESGDEEPPEEEPAEAAA
jgi:CRISPR-associated protein Csd1